MLRIDSTRVRDASIPSSLRAGGPQGHLEGSGRQEAPEKTILKLIALFYEDEVSRCSKCRFARASSHEGSEDHVVAPRGCCALSCSFALSMDGALYSWGRKFSTQIPPATELCVSGYIFAKKA